MEYKGYRARIEFDEEDKIFVGRILVIRDVIGFHASNVKELEKAFRKAVDDYLNHCKSIGKRPDRAFSGRFNLRLTPEQHRHLALEAEQAGVSLNEMAVRKLFRDD